MEKRIRERDYSYGEIMMEAAGDGHILQGLALVGFKGHCFNG